MAAPASKTPATKPPQDLFRANAVALVETLADLIKGIVGADLRDNIDTGAVEDLAEVIDSVKAVELVEMFILVEEEVWPKILAKDSQVFREDILKIFKKLPNNMDLLTLPVTVYFELVEGKHSKVEGMEDKKNWPITQQDINSLWTYCDKLLRNAYNYCVANPAAVTSLLSKTNAKIDTDNVLFAKKKLPLLAKKRPLNVSLYTAHVEAFTAKLEAKR